MNCRRADHSVRLALRTRLQPSSAFKAGALWGLQGIIYRFLLSFHGLRSMSQNGNIPWALLQPRPDTAPPSPGVSRGCCCTVGCIARCVAETGSSWEAGHPLTRGRMGWPNNYPLIARMQWSHNCPLIGRMEWSNNCPLIGDWMGWSNNQRWCFFASLAIISFLL